LAILGGTFDPVHNAHLAMARAALERLPAGRVLFIPTGTPPYREPPVASAPHRLAMLELALDADPKLAIDGRELAPGASGYTVDTLKALRADFPKEHFFLLMGSDQYSKLASWRRPEEVARLAEIAVFSRPGFPVRGGARVIPFETTDESASGIRARIARGEDISALVPPAVATYIERHRLYR
jgi:nicotinate-nucleotide adenylyltransferase